MYILQYCQKFAVSIVEEIKCILGSMVAQNNEIVVMDIYVASKFG